MSITYKFRKTEYGDPVDCDSCNSEAATGEFDWGPPYGEKHESEKRYLCEFCSSSFVGNYTRYPSRDTEGYIRKEIAVTIAQAVNFILSKKP